jgi:AGCS family alanine or glycine:cation symporter
MNTIHDFTAFANNIIANIATLGDNLLFFNIIFWRTDVKIPFLTAWLLVASLFFLFKLRFFTFKFIKIAFSSLLSKQIQQQQQNALEKSGKGYQTSKAITIFSIGSSVDLGSIFGVAGIVAITGLGSILWIIIIGILSAAIRFAEVVAGHYYRKIDSHGNFITGGPQIYIKKAFEQYGLNKLGKIIANIFSFCLVFSTFFSLQTNQTVMVITHFITPLKPYNSLVALFVAIIIMSLLSRGFSKITKFSGKIVPQMSKLYFISTAIIIAINIQNLLPTLHHIVVDAFSLKAGLGGICAVIVMATQRAFFCNETGMGSGAISHASSINNNSVLEGFISTVTPIITTGMVCVCSGLIVGITNAFTTTSDGVTMMIQSFSTVHPYFSYILLLVVPLFGISTAIAWAYYGQSIWGNLFGKKTIPAYNTILFISYVICGSVTSFGVILNLADVCNLAITIPNILALYLLSGKIAQLLKANK